MSGRRRLDVELVRRGLAPSRAQAQELIEQGKVRVGGAPASNSARQVSPGEPVTIVGPPPRFVSRGGEKLEAALDAFDVDVRGRRAIDVGASTGGFTDCLLQHGATSVVALDVGHGQLHEKMRADERVDVRERTNVRGVSLDDFGGDPFQVITVDVSFISLRTIAPALVQVLAAPDADLVTLVKPQFEAGRAEVSKGKGVVRSASVWSDVLVAVVSAMAELGAATMGVVMSPILGAEGNVEFLAWLRAGQSADAVREASGRAEVMIAEVVSEAARRVGIPVEGEDEGEGGQDEPVEDVGGTDQADELAGDASTGAAGSARGQ